MTEAQIKHLVDRFLGWHLPENFKPDDGICFEKFGNAGTPFQFVRRPSGTNLLDAEQATAMVRHMLEGMPQESTNEHNRLLNIESAAMALSTAMVDNEDKGADFELVDEEWMLLTAALQ